jgi:hypothetical protein
MKSIGCSEHHHNNNLKAAIALAKFVGSEINTKEVSASCWSTEYL